MVNSYPIISKPFLKRLSMTIPKMPLLNEPMVVELGRADSKPSKVAWHRLTRLIWWNIFNWSLSFYFNKRINSLENTVSTVVGVSHKRQCFNIKDSVNPSIISVTYKIFPWFLARENLRSVMPGVHNMFQLCL